MRIVGGKYKSRRILTPTDLKARPTTDFAKEGLFNVLNNMVDWSNTDALDLFSGTGSISFELLSRGCSTVVSVEKNHKNWQFINKTKQLLSAEDIYTINADSFKYIDKCKSTFNLIFADPPYLMEEVDSLPSIILSKEILRPGGIFILEHSSKHDFQNQPNFKLMKKYGKVHFSFFEK
ncbi:MAG: 16S rRNA (guanine(966)-N(2))-methyltransferase RsmD [Fermentimonas sp.]|jgi:16S rRNA (guanine966-N2)-methyltransferase